MHILLYFSIFLCSYASAQEKAAFIHVNIVDVEKGILLKDHIIMIDGGKITRVIPFTKKQSLGNYKVIDAEGKYMIPGLIDAHAHLHYFFKSNQQQLLQAALQVFLYHGVTGLREASGSTFTKEFIQLRDSIDIGKITAPKIYVSGIATSTNLKKQDASTYTELVSKFSEMGVDGIKVKFTTFTETKEIIDAAHALHLPVYGHTANIWKPDSFNILGDFTPGIVDYGIDGVMHTGGFPPFGKKNIPAAPPADSVFATWLYMDALWLYSDTILENRLIQKMINQDTWLEPTLTIEQIVASREQYRNDPSLLFALSSYDEYFSGYPPLTAVQKDSALRVFERKQIFVKKFHEAGGTILAGTDLFYGSSLHKELELLTDAGLSPAASLKTATYNNAKVLGWLEELGTVSEGKLASLVLLDKNPLENISNTRTINTVIIKGKIFYRQMLNDLMKEAKAMVTKQ